jgi:hypothetical protein
MTNCRCTLSEHSRQMLAACGVRHECNITTSEYDWRDATAKDRAARAERARAAEFGRRNVEPIADV